MALLQTLLYIIFVLSSIVLVVVILLQEGKGGGFGGALGAAGQQTFGVQTKGIQTFTGIVAAVFLVSAVTIHIVVSQTSATSLVDGQPALDAPAESGAGAGAAGGGDQRDG